MKNTFMILGLVGLMSMPPAMAELNEQGKLRYSENYDSVTSFCRDRLQVLKSAYRLAELESQAGNHARSTAILEAGLREAAARNNHAYASTLTSKAITRGIIVLENLKATEESKQKIRTINNFLFNYYLFVEKVSNQLDIPYFQSGRGFSGIISSNTQFERLFVDFAKEQVSMVLSTMSSTANEGRIPTIYPIGSTTLLLTALKVTTAAMANDLSESIFASRYACTIARLNQASKDIAYYLSSRTMYADEFMAVQELVGAVKFTIQGSLGSCGGIGGYGENPSGYSESESRTSDALTKAFYLPNGSTHQVKLKSGRFIKKLIISAQGEYTNAIFDVVVNGDVKGTIFVPGSDPSYFVTVQDYADSIEFVSRGGAAIISKILVVAE